VPPRPPSGPVTAPRRHDSPRLLVNVGIAEAIAELVQERSERARVAADQVVAELAKIAFVNMTDHMRIGER